LPASMAAIMPAAPAPRITTSNARIRARYTTQSVRRKREPRFPRKGWCNRGPVLGGTDPRLGRHSLTLGHFGVKASPLGNRGFAAMLRGNDMDIDFVGLDLFLPERVVPDRLKTKTTKTL
jgi:hypothetical protein